MANSKNAVQDSRGRGLSDEMISKLLLDGDITGLSEYERVLYYKAVCERVGLDPSTQPFSILKLKKKKPGGGYEPRTILYLNASGAQQLNRKHKVSHEFRDEKITKNIYRIFYRASTPDGRYTDSAGVVSTQGLTGDDLSNAIMRAETKAKRRSTVDLLGLAAFDGSGGTVFETGPGKTGSPPPSPEKQESKTKPGEDKTEPEEQNKSDADPGEVVFKFGWNKGQTIRAVYEKRGEKEIVGAIGWCNQNNKFPEFVQAAKNYLASVSNETPIENAEVKERREEDDDLPF